MSDGDPMEGPWKAVGGQGGNGEGLRCRWRVQQQPMERGECVAVVVAVVGIMSEGLGMSHEGRVTQS